MAETIRDVVVKVTIEQTDVKLKPPEVSDVTKAASKAEDALTEAAESASEAWEEANEAIEQTGSQISQTNDDLQQFSDEAVDSSLQAGEKMKGAAEEAFTLARGIAFVGTSSEENFKEVVERLAAVQGAFDIFKGGVEIIINTVEGMRALKVATGAATASQAALSVANTAVAKTATVASGAMATLQATLGPVGLAVTALGAGVAALVASWQFFSDGEASEGMQDAEEGVRGLRNEMEDTVPVAEKLRQGLELENVQRDFAQRERQLLKMRQSLKDQVDLQSRLNQLEEQREDRQERLRSLAEERLFQPLLEQTGVEGNAEDIIEEFGSVRKALEAIFTDRQAFLAEERQAVGEALLNDIEATVDAEEARLDTLREQEKSIEKQIEKEEKALEVAEKKLQAEQDRLQSLDEIVGRLSAEERLELQRLGQKVESGEKLSDEELRRLEDLGGKGTSEFVSERFAQRGRERGGAGLFDPFQDEPARGEGSREQELQRKVEEQRQRVEGEGGIVDTLEDQLDANAEAQEKQIDLLEQLNEQQRDFRERLEQIEDELDRQQRNAA